MLVITLRIIAALAIAYVVNAIRAKQTRDVVQFRSAPKSKRVTYIGA